MAVRSLRVFALYVLSLAASCVAGTESHGGTLQRFVFNGPMETIDYEVHQSSSSHRVVAVSTGARSAVGDRDQVRVRVDLGRDPSDS